MASFGTLRAGIVSTVLLLVWNGEEWTIKETHTDRARADVAFENHKRVMPNCPIRLVFLEHVKGWL
jgi:hypothetical protein